MKFLKILFLLFFVSQLSAQITKAEIIATGLTCSMCSNSINKQLKSITEVDSVQIDLNTNKFTVYFNAVNKLTPQVLKSKVEKAGFFIGDMVIYFLPQKELLTKFIALEGNLDELKLQKAKVLDKGYTTTKEYKKLSKKFKNSTLASNNEEDFHLIIL